MARSERDRQRDVDIIIEEKAAEIQEERMRLGLPLLQYIFPFAFFLLIGHFFCKMIGIEPRSVSTGIAVFTLCGGGVSLLVLIKKNLWKKYQNEIMPLLILAIIFLFVIVSMIRVHS